MSRAGADSGYQLAWGAPSVPRHGHMLPRDPGQRAPPAALQPVRARASGGPAPGMAGMMGHMSVVKINAITVPAESGDELARRFAARAGAVDNQDGFEGFELLKPTDGRTTWLVMTRWRDDASFEAWLDPAAVGPRPPSPAQRTGGPAPGPAGRSRPPGAYARAGRPPRHACRPG